MKRKNLFLTVCAGAFLLASCQSEDAMPGVDNASEMQTRAVIGEDYVVKNGVLHFTSLDSFFKVTEEIANMPDSLYQIWGEEHNFISYRTITDRLINEAEAMEDESEQNAFIAKHANYIKKENDLILPIMETNLYRSITNADGVFYVNGAKNVVANNEVVAYNASNEEINRSTYLSTKASIVEKSRKNYEERSKVRKDGKRMVITRAALLVQTAFDLQFARHALALEIFVDGKIKKAKWRAYSTTYHHGPIRVKLKQTPIGVDKNDVIIYAPGEQIEKGQAGTTSDSKNWTVTYTLSTPIDKEPQLTSIEYLYYNAYTRGTANEQLQYSVINDVTQDAK